MRYYRTEAILVFRRGDKGTNQGLLARRILPGETVYLPEPEIEAACFRIASQITIVKVQNKSAIVLTFDEGNIVRNLPQHAGASLQSICQTLDEGGQLRSAQGISGVGVQPLDKCLRRFGYRINREERRTVYKYISKGGFACLQL